MSEKNTEESYLSKLGEEIRVVVNNILEAKLVKRQLNNYRVSPPNVLNNILEKTFAYSKI